MHLPPGKHMGFYTILRKKYDSFAFLSKSPLTLEFFNHFSVCLVYIANTFFNAILLPATSLRRMRLDGNTAKPAAFNISIFSVSSEDIFTLISNTFPPLIQRKTHSPFQLRQRSSSPFSTSLSRGFCHAR